MSGASHPRSFGLTSVGMTPVTQKQLSLVAKDGEEVWTITTAARVWLQKTAYTRTGHPIVQDFSIGPRKAGTQFKILTSDREMNQERTGQDGLDPFRNGLLVRVDADQQLDDSTASEDALSVDDLLVMFGKSGNAFVSAVKKLGDVPLRRAREMADAVDASASQVRALDEAIQVRFRGAPLASGEREIVLYGGDKRQSD
jgi:hypothetical protein